MNTLVRKGKAMRVILYSEEGNCIENADVELYSNGLVYIKDDNEDTHMHIMNCEIVWNFKEKDPEDNVRKVNFRPKVIKNE